MPKKQRKSRKKLAPPDQRVDLEIDEKTNQPKNLEYWSILCSVCLEKIWARKMPLYGTVCARCWGDQAPRYWQTFWIEIFARCVHTNNFTAAHKSPTKEALQTLRSVKEYHPAIPKHLVLSGLRSASQGIRHLPLKKQWYTNTLPLVEEILATAPPPIESKQLTLNIFDLMLDSRKAAASEERKKTKREKKNVRTA